MKIPVGILFVFFILGVMSGLLVATIARGDDSHTPQKYRYGQSVRFAPCNTQAGMDWVSTGPNSAKRVPYKYCGLTAVIVGDGIHYCAPPHLNIDSCDPWEYKVKISKTGDTVEANEYRLGNGKRHEKRTLMDVLVKDPKLGKEYNIKQKEK